jgi:hypothetical protein
MSGYRIDQAIVHPNHPEKYILGIECDGAMYHSSPTAKERNVYRQDFWKPKDGRSLEFGVGIGGRTQVRKLKRLINW